MVTASATTATASVDIMAQSFGVSVVESGHCANVTVIGNVDSQIIKRYVILLININAESYCPYLKAYALAPCLISLCMFVSFACVRCYAWLLSMVWRVSFVKNIYLFEPWSVSKGCYRTCIYITFFIKNCGLRYNKFKHK